MIELLCDPLVVSVHIVRIWQQVDLAKRYRELASCILLAALNAERRSER